MAIPGSVTIENNIALENATLGHRIAKGDVPELYYLRVLGEAYVRNVASIKFTINVAQTGWYTLNYSGGPRSRKTGTFFMLYQDETLIGDITYDSKVDSKTSDLHKVHLEKGNHNLQLSFLLDLESMDMWNLGSLKFTKIEVKQ